MKVLIEFGDSGQYTILVPIETLGCWAGMLVRDFAYTKHGFVCGQKLINAEIVQYIS